MRRQATPPPQPQDLWALTTGANPAADGATTFRVWAPRARRVEVVFPQREGMAVALPAEGEGWYASTLPDVPPGSDYAYRLDGGPLLPDPVSRWQPQGVHGPSRVVHPHEFAWSDAGWRGLPLEQMVFYELHTGTFTPAGTFAGVSERLDYLAELGVTAVEVMPVAQYPGERNWGYDGVQLFAPQASYGGPQGFKALVDACHARGLALVLDVVYNHLGPEGNYLGAYGPYFSGRYHTPWGDALNFDDEDCEPVRRFFIDNALYWLSEYHVDGLRLDAVHGIFDFGARHVLAELAEAFQAQAARLGRRAWLIAESDLNDTRVIDPQALGGWGLDAQWSDDFHHAQHTLLTGAERGYFADFGRVGDLAKALQRGFVYDGGYSVYRRRRHGNVSAGRPGRQFSVAVQNHDQVANASGGRRLGQLVEPAREMLAAAVLLCAPNLPLLFMGQEFGARTPFHFFTSHTDPDLAKAVSEGRRRDYAAFQDRAPFMDPQAAETFAASRLDWACVQREPHAGVLRFYRDLLALRRAHSSLHEPDMARSEVQSHEGRRWLVLRRAAANGEQALLVCNYSPRPADIPLPVAGEAWCRALWSGAPDYGASGADPAPPPTLAALPAGELCVGPWQAVLYLHARPQNAQSLNAPSPNAPSPNAPSPNAPSPNAPSPNEGA